MENVQVNEEKNPSGVESGSPASRAGQASLIAEHARLEHECASTSAAVKAFPRQANGLALDISDPEYRAAKTQYWMAFGRLRTFNRKYAKTLRGGR